MSLSPFTGPPYSRPQRLVALGYGVACHILFAASVLAMFVSLYSGLTSGLLHLHGWSAAVLDVSLLVQFAAAHSLLLSDQGRQLMARLAPLGLGRALATTIFAAIASLQLLATFLFWSPSGVIWIAPEGPIKTGLTAAYLLSWFLLAKSMRDAGLDVQLGLLGWRSIWKNQPPVYQPFARTGTFRHSRQPIYSSFTLILWTAPVWTPDHLVLTLLWTAYCVFAPAWKEQRFRRFYGDAFARYQQRVPYWFPRFTPATMPAVPPGSEDPDCDIAIVGAGPVGLLLANLLGPTGLKIVVVEKHTTPPAHSRAIGITPPSLEILKHIGLVDAFVAHGVRICDVQVHSATGHLGTCSFRRLQGAHPYILSLPQKNTITLLEQNLSRFPKVSVLRGHEVLKVHQQAGQAALEFKETSISARFIVACDGWRSSIRSQLKIRTREHQYPCHFVMGDFIGQSGLGEEAHLFFTPDGAVESFPLPGGLRRWIVQTSESLADAPSGHICRLVLQRSGITLDVANQTNQSSFTPHRVDCEVLHDHRVILCGDAAHAMSPIGGQGMNVGFADAEMLAGALKAILVEGAEATSTLDTYERVRQRAARMAAARAAQGMSLGTWRGQLLSGVRDFLLQDILLQPPLSCLVAARFAMLDLPRGNCGNAGQ